MKNKLALIAIVALQSCAPVRIMASCEQGFAFFPIAENAAKVPYLKCGVKGEVTIYERRTDR